VFSVVIRQASFPTSIPGVSLPIGAALLAEIGDVSRFEALEKLVAHAGY
jgi:hypothetical protein